MNSDQILILVIEFYLLAVAVTPIFLLLRGKVFQINTSIIFLNCCLLLLWIVLNDLTSSGDPFADGWNSDIIYQGILLCILIACYFLVLSEEKQRRIFYGIGEDIYLSTVAPSLTENDMKYEENSSTIRSLINDKEVYDIKPFLGNLGTIISRQNKNNAKHNSNSVAPLLQEPTKNYLLNWSGKMGLIFLFVLFTIILCLMVLSNGIPV